MTQEFNIVTDLRGFEVNSILNIIITVFHRHGIPTDQFSVYGPYVDLPRASVLLKKINRSTFSIIGHGYEIHLMSVRNYKIDILSIKCAAKLGIWDEWIKELSKNNRFHEAWLVDADYDFWQNAEDPLQYSTHGRAWNLLPKRSNGLPAPLDQIVIDTSQNPGRRVLHPGYVEAVGSPMWLGRDFWRRTGADPERLRSEGIECCELPGGFLRILVDGGPFSTDQGATGIAQRKLRALLFPDS